MPLNNIYMIFGSMSCASRDIFKFVKENFEKLQGLFQKALEEFFLIQCLLIVSC